MNYLEFLHGASDLLQLEAGLNACSFPDWDSVYAGVNFADERLPEFDDTVGVRRDWFTVQISMRELYSRYIEYGWERVTMEVRGFFSIGGGRRVNDYKSRLDDEGKRFYEALRRLRAELARENRVAAFCIFTNRTLYELCRLRPRTIAELKKVYGIGERKAAKYGARVLTELFDLAAGRQGVEAEQLPPLSGEMQDGERELGSLISRDDGERELGFLISRDDAGRRDEWDDENEVGLLVSRIEGPAAGPKSAPAAEDDAEQLLPLLAELNRADAVLAMREEA